MEDKNKLNEALSMAGDDDFEGAAEKFAEIEGSKPEITGLGQELEQKMKDSDYVKAVYKLTPENVETAMKIFYKKIRARRDLIFIIILLVLLAANIHSVVIDSKYSVGYFLICTCAVLIGYIIYLPYRNRRSAAAAAAAVNDDFVLTFFDDCMYSGEGDTAKKIRYDAPSKRKKFFHETNELFVISPDGENLFAFEKKSAGDIKKLREMLKKAYTYTRDDEVTDVE